MASSSPEKRPFPPPPLTLRPATLTDTYLTSSTSTGSLAGVLARLRGDLMLAVYDMKRFLTVARFV